MAAGKWKLYDTAKLKIGDGTIDLDTHSFKMALFLSTSNCNTLTHDELGDLTNQHANANGYTTGGQTLSTTTWTNASGTITFDCVDPVWTASGGSIVAHWAVIYDDTAANDPLLCVSYMNYNGGAPADVTTTDGNTLTGIIAATGIFTLSGATSDT